MQMLMLGHQLLAHVAAREVVVRGGGLRPRRRVPSGRGQRIIDADSDIAEQSRYRKHGIRDHAAHAHGVRCRVDLTRRLGHREPVGHERVLGVLLLLLLLLLMLPLQLVEEDVGVGRAGGRRRAGGWDEDGESGVSPGSGGGGDRGGGGRGRRGRPRRGGGGRRRRRG